MDEKEANLLHGKSASERFQGIDPAVLQQLLQIMADKRGSAGSETPITLSATQNSQETVVKNQDINLIIQLLEQRLAPEERRKWETLRIMASLLGVR